MEKEIIDFTAEELVKKRLKGFQKQDLNTPASTDQLCDALKAALDFKILKAIDKLNGSIEKLDTSTSKANGMMIALNVFMVILTVAIVVLTWVLLIKTKSA